jgi:hypothetical protein
VDLIGRGRRRTARPESDRFFRRRILRTAHGANEILVSEEIAQHPTQQEIGSECEGPCRRFDPGAL